MNLNKLFVEHCKSNQLEINNNQISTIKNINKFYQNNFTNNIFSNFFIKKNNNIGFYLQGDVGVGKTMILNFFYNNLNCKKQRFHFNEFMIGFHDFIFRNKNTDKSNSIDKFVDELKKKYKLIYFDEFQVTNIVDAMILGNLFKRIFEQNIKVIFSSNLKINDLYKNGLQRDQFLPFIEIMKKRCHEYELIIDEDYRISKNDNRFFFPLDEKTLFKINKIFRKLTKNINREEKKISIKERIFLIKNYYNRIAKFDFDDLCNKNIGAEDYIKIAEACDHILIENIPAFKENNSNQQQRFITLIDIVYEKKIKLTISSELDLKSLTSSKNLFATFKRTSSRLYELTSNNLN